MGPIAHGIVGRADLPIPMAWFAVAAAVVLVVSFLALAFGWSRTRLERVPERPLVGIGSVTNGTPTQKPT